MNSEEGFTSPSPRPPCPLPETLVVSFPRVCWVGRGEKEGAEEVPREVMTLTIHLLNYRLTAVKSLDPQP